MKEKTGKIIGTISKVLEWIIFSVLLVVFFILLSPLLPTKEYFSTYVISTGSMEPTMPVGTVALTRPVPANEVNVDDILAFSSPVETDKVIMHRVIDINTEGTEITFKTKGDNNNAPDNWVVYPMHLKGELVYQVPYIGHIVAFIQTKVGFALAIGIPGLLLVFSQLKRIKEGVDEEIEKRVRKKIAKGEHIASLVLGFLLLNALLLIGTIKIAQALFVSQAQVNGISITVKDFVPPDLPIHLAPADGSVMKSTDILFDWTDVTDYENQNNPVYYIFQMSDSLSFATIHYTSGELSDSQTSAPALGDGTFYWRVKACDAIDNCTDWTTGWEITIDDTAPTKPIWVRPSDGSKTHQSEFILVDWTDSVDANLAGYEYENRKVGGSTWKSIDSCGLLSESQIPNVQIGTTGTCLVVNAGTLSADGEYIRRVRSKDQAGNYSPWSDEWSITKDSIAPTSEVSDFSSSSTTEATIDVAYTASDSGTGVKQVELFYRLNGGSWTSYGTFSSSPISFAVPNPAVGGTYDFYTIAEDMADDLTSADMADGSAGDNGIGNKEMKTPIVEASIEYSYAVPGTSPGDVVINELMWMGSTKHVQDEWIELRNMTGSAIDLNGWKIDNAGSGGGDDIELTGTIPAGGFYLLTAYKTDHTNGAISDSITADQIDSHMNMHNNGEVLVLKNGSGTVIDQTPAGSWAAGVNAGTNKSMERNSIPGDGTLPESWQTCIDSACNDTTFWDAEGNDYGTPKAPNKSENDLSLKLVNPLVEEEIPEEPEVIFAFRTDKRAVRFEARHISDFTDLQYEITYESDGEQKGIIGSVEINGQESVARNDILLGTCSSAGLVCVYDTAIDTVHLRVTLNAPESEVIIQKELQY